MIHRVVSCHGKTAAVTVFNVSAKRRLAKRVKITQIMLGYTLLWFNTWKTQRHQPPLKTGKQVYLASPAVSSDKGDFYINYA